MLFSSTFYVPFLLISFLSFFFAFSRREPKVWPSSNKHWSLICQKNHLFNITKKNLFQLRMKFTIGIPDLSSCYMVQYVFLMTSAYCGGLNTEHWNSKLFDVQISKSLVLEWSVITIAIALVPTIPKPNYWFQLCVQTVKGQTLYSHSIIVSNFYPFIIRNTIQDMEYPSMFI